MRRCRNKRLSCFVLPRICLTPMSSLAPSSHKSAASSPPDRAQRYVRQNKKTKPWPVEQVVRKQPPPPTTTITTIRICVISPRLRAVTGGFSCRSLGEISRLPVWARSPLIIDGALQWRFVTTATVHGPIKLHRCPLLFVPRIVQAISCLT